MSEPIYFQYQPDVTIADIDPAQITGLLVGDAWYPVTLGERASSSDTIRYVVGTPESTVVSA